MTTVCALSSYNYFNTERNIALIDELLQNSTLEREQITQIKKWVITNFNTPHRQDELHIIKRFVLPTLESYSPELLKITPERYTQPSEQYNTEFTEILKYMRSHILSFYIHRHTFSPQARDIKQYKTYTNFYQAFCLNQEQMNKNWKIVRDELKPIYNDERFTIIHTNTFLESKVINKGHPVFENNLYSYCTGHNEKHFKRYCFRGTKKNERVANMFFIRDKTKSAKFTYITGKPFSYQDPEHIIMLIVYVESKSVILHYSSNNGTSMSLNSLLTKKPELTQFKDIFLTTPLLQQQELDVVE